MNLYVLRGGKFTASFNAKRLASGLRHRNDNVRNSNFLTTSFGTVGKDGVLQSLDTLSRLTTDEITDSFPYPQIFALTNLCIVCGKTSIYEFDGSSLELKIDNLTEGDTWTCVDYFDFVYLSNGKIVVTRDALNKEYSVVDSLPVAKSACDFKGQMIVGGLYE